jgi:hypothetical protein
MICKLTFHLIGKKIILSPPLKSYSSCNETRSAGSAKNTRKTRGVFLIVWWVLYMVPDLFSKVSRGEWGHAGHVTG